MLRDEGLPLQHSVLGKNTAPWMLEADAVTPTDAFRLALLGKTLQRLEGAAMSSRKLLRHLESLAL